MTGPTRPTAVVLFIHNGSPGYAHVKVREDAGLRVSVSHGAAAVAAAKTQQPDLIVLDAGESLRIQVCVLPDSVYQIFAAARR